MDSKSNRVSPHEGKTNKQSKDAIKIHYDAELKDLPLCDACYLFCFGCCGIYSKERSYLYIRENSLESNISLALCCGFCQAKDFVTVEYYDRSPYSKECKMAPFPFCLCWYCDQPKLEVVDPTYTCCFIPVTCCGSKKVVLMPFENMPPPCCCCSNRVGCCDNCFGCCGPKTGNPKIFFPFVPQPTDAQGFVDVAQRVMLDQPDNVEIGRVSGMHKV